MGFSNLPNELIREISGWTERRDLLFLCQTSRQMHAICLQWIYRLIVLDDAAQVVRCFKTIISRTEAANSARILKISCTPRHVFKSFGNTFRSGIKRLKYLQRLDVSSSLTLFRLLSSVHFPLLTHCSIPSSTDMMPFLKEHPLIAELEVLPNFEEGTVGAYLSIQDTAFERASHTEPISMPKLQCFSGPAVVAYLVVPGSPTSHLSIYWGDGISRATSFSDGVATLARASVDVVELSSLICTWDRTILSALAKHMPRIQHLAFRNIRDYEEREIFVAAVEDTLPALPMLHTLHLLEGIPTASQDDHLDEEFETVRRWGDIGPQLYGVSLPGNTPWGCLSGAWLPGALPSALLTGHKTITLHQLKWFLRTVVTRTLPQQYSRAAQALTMLNASGLLAIKRGLERDSAFLDSRFTGFPPSWNIDYAGLKYPINISHRLDDSFK
ncbi:hypothetical protein C8R43DRAFT_1008826 [Mycena crocata]|nr:hypothetical protein C8R43DRAFT_1008826 [Mycena crocata]